MKMKKTLCATLLALGPTALMAGFVQPAPITVNLNADGSGSATGDMATARFSANNVEYIGCGTRTFDDGVNPAVVFGFCQASTPAAVLGFCSTEDPDLVDAIRSLSDYSFVTFAWNAAGECRTVGNSTQSFYIPVPPKK